MKNILILIFIFSVSNLIASAEDLTIGTDTVNSEVLIFELLTDEFPAETSWELVDEASDVLFSGDGIADNYEQSTKFIFSFQLPAEGCYRFIISDASSDGICCGYGEGSYRLLSGSGDLLIKGGEFGNREEFNFYAKFGGNASDDAAILNIDFEDKTIGCGGTPSIRVLNSGSEPISTLKLATLIDGSTQDTINWSGNLLPGKTTNIELKPVILLNPTPFSVEILLVNNQSDNSSFNNNVTFTVASTAMPALNNVLLLELTTDNFPAETSWELMDYNGTTLFSGNGTDYGASEELAFFLPLPSDGCYEFAIFDSAGDGMCCAFGFGQFKLSDAFGNVLYEGGNFFAEDRASIFVSADNQPANDAAILSLTIDQNASTCGTKRFEPELVIANIGTDDITTLDLEILLDDGTSTLQNWTGTLPSGLQESITLNPINGVLTDSVAVKIIKVNGQNDNADFKNEIKSTLRPTFLLVREETDFILEMQLDTFAYEVYWQITNSGGDVVAFGGNEAVGPNGAGLRISSQSDPGAYQPNELVSETFSLPLDDCYQFLMVDDFADGIDFPNEPFLDLKSNNNSLLFLPLSRVPFSVLSFDIETLGTAISTNELIAANEMNIFPNPTSGELNVEFTLSDNSFGNINVLDLLGKRVHTITNQTFYQGENNFQIDTDNLTSGIYFLQISAEGKQTTRKFQVIK